MYCRRMPLRSRRLLARAERLPQSASPNSAARSRALVHTSFFIIKEDISLCYGLGMDMVHPDLPFQSIREKSLKREIKGMTNS